jgi:hypothetical protein
LEKDIREALDQFYPDLPTKSRLETERWIARLLKENRQLFHVFSLERDKNVTETIFKAIFAGKEFETRASSLSSFSPSQLTRRKSKSGTVRALTTNQQLRNEERIKVTS